MNIAFYLNLYCIRAFERVRARAMQMMTAALMSALL